MNSLEVLNQALMRRHAQETVKRIFHGPGEGRGELSSLTLDQFDEHLWIEYEGSRISDELSEVLRRFIKTHGFRSAAIVFRQKLGSETRPAEVFVGDLPPPFVVQKDGARFQIDFNEQRHPGLFLDTTSVRKWLTKNSTGKSVLNLFSYTGSLSVAAGIGGASEVTSVDLSRNFTQWAQRNWALNDLSSKADFIYGDVFDWLKRFAKRSRRFDMIICDPPSFSRSSKGNFSTEKNLKSLHDMILNVLQIPGILITSINSQKVSRRRFESNIFEACDQSGLKYKVLERILLPDDFPSTDRMTDYLKGLILELT